jgi:hypothetical protein
VALIIRMIGTIFSKKTGTVPREFPINRQQALVKAESYLYRQAQQDCFAEVLAHLKHGNSLRETHLVKLRPFLDSHGVMRSNSRLAHTKFLRFSQKSPVILPRDHHLTTLVIRHYHENVLQHVGGHAHTLAELQTKFWIIQGRQITKKLVKECVKCKLYRKQPITQAQGNLPEYRIPTKRQAPFSNVIIDAAGPFKVKHGRGTAKRYVILYSCMITRAVHFELANDLSQDQFLLSFSRFVARRGYPDVCRSDNGTNFRGAVSDLMMLERVWDPTKAEKAGFGQLKWLFSTPYAPHTQGAIERMVGLLKQALNVNIGTEAVNETLLITTLTKVEYILNSRPLTYISNDPADPLPITANDFLLPWAKNDPEPVSEDGSRLLKLWNQTNHLLDRIWRFFVKQMLPTLHKTTVKDGENTRRNLQVGDIVAVLDEKERGRWPLARVERTFTDSRDDKVRFALIRMTKMTNNGSGSIPESRTFERNVNRLMLLIPSSIEQLGKPITSPTANAGQNGPPAPLPATAEYAGFQPKKETN